MTVLPCQNRDYFINECVIYRLLISTLLISNREVLHCGDIDNTWESASIIIKLTIASDPLWNRFPLFANHFSNTCVIPTRTK